MKHHSNSTAEFQPILLERLHDPKEAVAYLNTAMKDGDMEIFIHAVKDVAESQGGLKKIAEKIHFITA